MDSHRTERISEALREELSEIIAYEMADPRVASAFVTDVHVSPDLRHALIHIGFQQTGEAGEGIAALTGARHFLRGEVTRRLGVFRVPELHFESDVSVALGNRMEQLLKRVRRGR
ncbi:MAG: 30S ribosome-binding factor RbfA, partial [Bryobacteraceae bacterium]